jgi:hypothetical protein
VQARAQAAKAEGDHAPARGHVAREAVEVDGDVHVLIVARDAEAADEVLVEVPRVLPDVGVAIDDHGAPSNSLLATRLRRLQRRGVEAVDTSRALLLRCAPRVC